MQLIYYWPDGTWCLEQEVYKPEPGFTIAKLPETWSEARIDQYVRTVTDPMLTDET